MFSSKHNAATFRGSFVVDAKKQNAPVSFFSWDGDQRRSVFIHRCSIIHLTWLRILRILVQKEQENNRHPQILHPACNRGIFWTWLEAFRVISETYLGDWHKARSSSFAFRLLQFQRLWLRLSLFSLHRLGLSHLTAMPLRKLQVEKQPKCVELKEWEFKKTKSALSTDAKSRLSGYSECQRNNQ
jgi:hypothetical protein